MLICFLTAVMIVYDGRSDDGTPIVGWEKGNGDHQL